MNHKKILLISHELTVTGAPKVLVWLADFLKSQNCEVDFWTLSGGNYLDTCIQKNINPVFIENTRRDIKSYFEQNKKNYDLIICNTIITYKAVDVLHRYNIPVMWYVHEIKILNEYMQKRKDFAKLFKNFYNLYTVSDYAAGVVRKYNPNVKIIRNGVIDEFKNFNKLTNNIRFGFIGSIVPVKGIDLLINAFCSLQTKYPENTLTIAGQSKGDFNIQLKLQTQNNSNIIWLGEVQGQQKKDFFNSIDVLCVPSLEESACLSLLEGAMMGKALITTDKTGANHVVKQNGNGFIVKAGNEMELIEAMEKIQSSDIAQMQKKSRETYLNEATIFHQEKDTLKMLEDNWNNFPIINTKLKLERKKLFKKIKNGEERIIYLGKFRIFHYFKKKKNPEF